MRADSEELLVTPPGIRARDITAALRHLYAHAPIRTWAGPDGTATVRLTPAVARYLGVGRDNHQAAAWISVYAPYGVRVTGYDWTSQAVMVTLARTEHSRPADPRRSAGVPSYQTLDQVTGDFPANRMVTGLIRLAIEAGCRPHIGPQRSPHGRRYPRRAVAREPGPAARRHRRAGGLGTVRRRLVLLGPRRRTPDQRPGRDPAATHLRPRPPPSSQTRGPDQDP